MQPLVVRVETVVAVALKAWQLRAHLEVVEPYIELELPVFQEKDLLGVTLLRVQLQLSALAVAVVEF